MTDRYGDDDTEPDELDEDGNPMGRLTPTARQHLDAARAALSRPTERRSK